MTTKFYTELQVISFIKVEQEEVVTEPKRTNKRKGIWKIWKIFVEDFNISF